LITAEELAAYVSTLQAAGVTGRAKIGDIEITIPPVVDARAADAPKRSAKAEYDNLLFACTEGLREEDEAQS
jgi:hypothetical protein